MSNMCGAFIDESGWRNGSISAEALEARRLIHI
jgi:hypothetical protein